MPTSPRSMSYAELDAAYGSGGMTNVKFGEYQMFGFRDDEDVFAEFYINGGKAIKESIWKAHVSLGPTSLAAGWDIVHPMLVAARVHHFKVARQSACRSKANRLASGASGTAHQIGQGLADLGRMAGGMQITVYIPEGGEQKAQELMKKIERAFRKAKLIPGVIDKSDRELGLYCSVRNDGGAASYQSHDKATSYNATGAHDPFKKIH